MIEGIGGYAIGRGWMGECDGCPGALKDKAGVICGCELELWDSREEKGLPKYRPEFCALKQLCYKVKAGMEEVGIWRD